MDFIFFDSGLSEIIRLNLLKRLENKALYPLTPSPDVILLVGSDNIFISFSSAFISNDFLSPEKSLIFCFKIINFGFKSNKIKSIFLVTS